MGPMENWRLTIRAPLNSAVLYKKTAQKFIQIHPSRWPQHFLGDANIAPPETHGFVAFVDVSENPMRGTMRPAAFHPNTPINFYEQILIGPCEVGSPFSGWRELVFPQRLRVIHCLQEKLKSSFKFLYFGGAYHRLPDRLSLCSVPLPVQAHVRTEVN